MKDSIVTFGKYKGSSIEDIFETDPYYIVWVYDNVLTQDVISDELYEDAIDTIAKDRNYE